MKTKLTSIFISILLGFVLAFLISFVLKGFTSQNWLLQNPGTGYPYFNIIPVAADDSPFYQRYAMNLLAIVIIVVATLFCREKTAGIDSDNKGTYDKKFATNINLICGLLSATYLPHITGTDTDLTDQLQKINEINWLLGWCALYFYITHIYLSIKMSVIERGSSRTFDFERGFDDKPGILTYFITPALVTAITAIIIV